MTIWRHLKELTERGEPCVLVSVAGAEGSTPRGPGTKMIVTAAAQTGTIGGGHLEYVAARTARELIADGIVAPRLEDIALGPSLGQCCGGRTQLLFEPFGNAPTDAAWLDAVSAAERAGQPALVISAVDGPAPAKLAIAAAGVSGSLGDEPLDAAARAAAERVGENGRATVTSVTTESGERSLYIESVQPPDLEIVLFGAGHVARALVPMLAALPVRITWIDQREEQFPENVWDNVAIEVSETPEQDVDHAPPGAYFLVMTHSHDLDFKVTERILRRGDFAYLGLIGSTTKRRRFEKHFLRRGISEGALARLTCPIGIAGVSGKLPAEIAVAVAAQMLQHRDASKRAADPAVRAPLSA